MADANRDVAPARQGKYELAIPHYPAGIASCPLQPEMLAFSWAICLSRYA